MDVGALVRPVVEVAGLELVEISFGRVSGRRVLSVVVDRDGGVDVDAISELAEKISRRLDLEGFEAGPYALEVSSPGLERPLRTPAQFRRSVGSRVKVRTAVSLEGSRTFEGELSAADDEAIVVAASGTERRIKYADVASARTVVDWDAELKGSNA